jgi:hypothetical protein
MGTARTANPGYDVGDDDGNREGDNDPGALPDRDAISQSNRLHQPGWRKGAPAESIQAQSKRCGNIPEELANPRSPPQMLKRGRSKHTRTKINQSWWRTEVNKDDNS